jgi:hypothetical protein
MALSNTEDFDFLIQESPIQSKRNSLDLTALLNVATEEPNPIIHDDQSLMTPTEFEGFSETTTSPAKTSIALPSSNGHHRSSIQKPFSRMLDYPSETGPPPLPGFHGSRSSLNLTHDWSTRDYHRSIPIPYETSFRPSSSYTEQTGIVMGRVEPSQTNYQFLGNMSTFDPGSLPLQTTMAHSLPQSMPHSQPQPIPHSQPQSIPRPISHSMSHPMMSHSAPSSMPMTMLNSSPFVYVPTPMSRLSAETQSIDSFDETGFEDFGSPPETLLHRTSLLDHDTKLDIPTGAMVATREARRVIHVLSEQKRREKIKSGLGRLQQEVPCCEGKRMSKIGVIQESLRYIQQLKEEQFYLIAELDRIRLENEQLRNERTSFQPNTNRKMV